ncbi:PucR family transcriptional regulator [Aeromicrobium sp. CF4.19]|uniref:PucR family transcriptional regulator n=1 Tax=Aeromicrobium sp. CF4.19 TaxID=3373082 RepID=UPI003EE6CC30
MQDAVSALRDELGPSTSTAHLVRTFRPRLPALVQAITAKIQSDVTAYAGRSTGRRRKLIDMAVAGAIEHFLELVQDPNASSRRVDELFRRMGHGEATDGRTLDAMQTSLHIATKDAWREIGTVAVQHGIDAQALGMLGNLLFDYIDHLSTQAAEGHAGGRDAVQRDRGSARSQLLEELLAGAPPRELQSRAATAVWPLPRQLVIMTVLGADETDLPVLDDLPATCLTRTSSVPAVVICPAEAAPGVIDAVTRRNPDARCGISWAVRPDQAPDASRWAERVLLLADAGVVPDQPVLHCTEHRTQLWLHSEPALRQRLCQDLLSPLLAETPNSREILSETLLCWLETRESAPAIAATLGVHPQTIRYRWKRINEIFGETLHEPEFIVQITMVLKASVPLWKSGDQSDFERYRGEDPP